jgi:hypothetical protein
MKPTHTKDSIETLKKSPRECGVRRGFGRIDDVEIKRSSGQMNQTSNESERGHWKEYRLDREDMLGCTWTMA